MAKNGVRERTRIGEAEVLSEVGKPALDAVPLVLPGVVGHEVLANRGNLAEAALGFAARCLGRATLGDQVAGPLFEVEAELIVDVPADALATDGNPPPP